MRFASVLDKAREERPDIISIYWNAAQILRIEEGNTVIDRPAQLGAGLLTVHFDDNAIPIYSLVVTDE